MTTSTLQHNDNKAVEVENRVIKKLFRRLITFLFVLFVFSFLDRINIGFAGLTIRMVAAHAGVGAATAYTYFSSKEHLVAEVFWRRFDAHVRTVAPAYTALQSLRQELVAGEKARLRLEQFQAKPLSSFVRNRLIDEVYLPIVGDNLAKAFEAKAAVAAGADEVDMVINIGAIKDQDMAFVEQDIKAVVEAAKPAIVKVIIETCLLTDEEKTAACEASVRAGAAFVKTSTGFSTGGATVHDVALMKQAVKGQAKVKASGGIRTPEFTAELVEAGADRIGAGDGVKLMK